MPLSTPTVDMKRFHALVDRELQGRITPAETVELSSIRRSFDKKDAAQIAGLRRVAAVERRRFNRLMTGLQSQFLRLKAESSNGARRPKAKTATTD